MILSNIINKEELLSIVNNVVAGHMSLDQYLKRISLSDTESVRNVEKLSKHENFPMQTGYIKV